MDFIMTHWQALVSGILCAGAVVLGIAMVRNWMQKNVVLAILDGMAAIAKKTPMTWDDDLIAAVRNNASSREDQD